MAQYLEKELKNTLLFNREPTTIKNELKLPYFFELHCPKPESDFGMTTYELEYMPLPPAFQEVMSFLKKK